VDSGGKIVHIKSIKKLGLLQLRKLYNNIITDQKRYYKCIKYLWTTIFIDINME